MSTTSIPETQKQWSWAGEPNGFDGLKLRESAVPQPGPGEGKCTRPPATSIQLIPTSALQSSFAFMPSRSTSATSFLPATSIWAKSGRTVFLAATRLERSLPSARVLANGRLRTASLRHSTWAIPVQASLLKSQELPSLTITIRRGRCCNTECSRRARWCAYQRT